jgi:hypothetical protein
VCESWVPSSRFFGAVRRTRNCNAHASAEFPEKPVKPTPNRARGARMPHMCHAARAPPDTDVPVPGRCAESTMDAGFRAGAADRLYRRFISTGAAGAAIRGRRGPLVADSTPGPPTGVARKPLLRSTSAAQRGGVLRRIREAVLRARQCHGVAWHGWCKSWRGRACEASPVLYLD